MTTAGRHETRIVLVEDHTLFADSLDMVFTVEGYDVRRIAIPDEGGSMASILSAILASHPRIVLLDLDLGRLGDATRLIGPIARAGVNVVVVTASPDRGRWGECLRLGARKVISKSRPLTEILSTVRRLVQGLPVTDVAEREELLQLWHQERSDKQAARERLDRLTQREREVLAMLVKGRAVRDIAADKVVSEATVRTQVKSILSKLEVSSQLAAVGLAHHVGWVPPPH
ncbi:helix-turn-helix transcriptional regulator [Nocardioides marmotae]|uniref:helix-turn-helix transcriptional regulator n=1 Tax=Nocardioides marmotae TaxID=2663857 RepID=UPI001321A3D4|nr:response regulator transcription factor [Nocardioides marmotae]MBC9733449.1 response regulator transcription factor [Nocardioides marmotae]MTB84556.1 response regulator [Nocardioides marmotae]